MLCLNLSDEYKDQAVSIILLIINYKFIFKPHRLQQIHWIIRWHLTYNQNKHCSFMSFIWYTNDDRTDFGTIPDMCVLTARSPGCGRWSSPGSSRTWWATGTLSSTEWRSSESQPGLHFSIHEAILLLYRLNVPKNKVSVAVWVEPGQDSSI